MLSNEQMFNSFLFENAHVCKRGKIFPFGVIRIFVNEGVEEEGIAMWSPRLEEYGDSSFCARVDGKRKAVVVFQERTLREVEVIPFSAFQPLKVYECVILKTGYLLCPEYHGRIGNFEEALAKAMGDEDPELYSNESFIRVHAKHANNSRHFFILETYGFKDSVKVIAVYNENGWRVLNFEESKPLSYERWDKKFGLPGRIRVLEPSAA